MKSIFKLKITTPDQDFDAPAGATGLKVMVQHMQDGLQPILYLICDRTLPPAKHKLTQIATGQIVPDDTGEYVDTFIIPGPSGPLAVHVFHKQLGIITKSS